MNLDTFAGIVELVRTHGYLFLFLIMVIEGPLVTAAAGFLASLDVFNVMIVLLLSMLGNFTSDLAFYFIGRAGRSALISRYGSRVGLTPLRIARIEELLKQNTAKTIVAVKLTPFVASWGLMAAGAARVPLTRFLAVSAGVVIPYALVLTAMGYGVGVASASLAKYLNLGPAIAVVGVLLVVAVFYLLKNVSARLASRIEEGKDAHRRLF